MRLRLSDLNEIITSMTEIYDSNDHSHTMCMNAAHWTIVPLGSSKPSAIFYAIRVNIIVSFFIIIKILQLIDVVLVPF